MMIRHQQRSIACANRALAEAEITIDDIRRVIVHNVAKDDAKAYLSVLGFPLRQSTWEYGATMGHIGASDHMISLVHLLATEQVGPGDYVLLSGFSPG